MSALQQVNIRYELEQDRLLLRARTGTGEEYRLWLTRRYAALLWQVLQERIDKAGGMHQLAADQRTTKHLRQGAFDQPYAEAEPDRFPLGTAGILGYGINVADLPDGGLALRLLPREGSGLTLNLDQPLLYLVSNLLEQAILQADWRLPLAGNGQSALH